MKLVSKRNVLSDPFWSFADPSIFNSLLETVAVPTVKNNRTPMNIIENNNVYNIELSIPGWKKSEIKIEIEEDTLKISGEKESSGEEGHEKDGTYFLREFKTRKFYRSVLLSDTIDRENIEANLEDGVLHIVLPKVPEAQPEAPKQIEIR